MMTIRHGIDLVECARVAEVLHRHPQRFTARVLTASERERAASFRNPVPFIAGRWAAKEAILKMLGTGWRGKIAWTDIEILPDSAGQPRVTLRAETQRIAASLGISNVTLSITHTEHYAAASAIGLVHAPPAGEPS